MLDLVLIVSLCVLISLCAASMASAAGSAKTGRTLVTDEEIATARENVAHYDWAANQLRELKQNIVKGPFWNGIGVSVDQLIQLPDDKLWSIMPDTRIHRTHYVNQHKGCPVHGIEIKKFDNFHPWNVDPINRPYKIQCPVGGEWYPSNDFAHGDLTSGDFPDDGTGYKRGEDTYYFIGEYCHAVYLAGVRTAMDRMAEIYALTGDRRYAHKAAVLLLAVAHEFPNSTDRQDRCLGGKWGTVTGLITDCIWSCGDIASLARSYDLVYDRLDDPELLAFARTKLPEVKTGADFRFYIEENMLRVGAKALMDKVVVGNFGNHQDTASILALVLDDVKGRNHPDSRELISWLYDKADGPLRTFARTVLLKDGGAAESPMYNGSRQDILSVMERVDKLIDRHPQAFPRSLYPDLWEEPKVKAMADYFTDLVMLDQFIPGIGDNHGSPLIPRDSGRWRKTLFSSEAAEICYRHYGDDRYAWMLVSPEGNVRHSSVYQRQIDDKLRAAAQRIGAFPKRPTTLLDGYGVAILRSGEENDQRAAWLFYGATRDHAHRDPLCIGYDAKGMSLLPDLGYPKSWDFSYTWEQNLVTHNTVIIDRGGPYVHDLGRLLALQSTPGIELIDAEADPYRNGTEDAFSDPKRLYRRATMLVDLSSEDSYLVDLFRVRGGGEHWQSWHGPAVVPTFEGPAMTAQPKGTLAGENVEYNTPRPGADGKPFRDALCMFTNVQRGKTEGPWSLDYPLGGKRDVHVRITGLPEPGTELILADGRAPSDPNDYTVRYAFASRKGDAPLESQYLTVVEPYSGKRVIDRIESLDAAGKALPGYRPAGVRVVSGEIEDTILSTGIATGTARVGESLSLKGDTALVRHRGGKLDRLFLSNGSFLSAGDCSLTLARAEIAGEIVALDRNADEITVSIQTSCPEALVGRRIRIHNDLHHCAYIIREARAAGPGRVRLKLNTTSLLAEGIASAFEDGIVSNREVMFEFAGMRKYGGIWHHGYSLYRGATLENEAENAGKRVWDVSNEEARTMEARTSMKYDVWLEKDRKTPAAELARIFTDTNKDGRISFRLYDYGVGDQVTLPGIASLRATGENIFALEATDDVTLALGNAKLELRREGSAEWTPVSGEIPLSVSGGKAEIRVEKR